MMQKSLVFLLFCLLSVPVRAQERPAFQWPVDCTLNEDCWFLNYVDMDPAADSYKDPECQARGYDGHKGTDIAVRSKAEMDKGVDVLAAAGGTIEKIRDSEPDRFPTEDDIKASEEARKECGNAVLIDHGNSLKTVYCHLKKGSIVVEPGAEVAAGDKLAQIGLSGVTEFPHLHFGVIWEGAIMDPFSGRSNTQGCEGIDKPLWANPQNVQYQETSIYNGGFSTKIIDLEALDHGEQGLTEASPDQPLLILWLAVFGINTGDQIEMRIIDPDGRIFTERKIEQDRTRAQHFYYVGKKTSEAPLLKGIYQGEVTLKRSLDDGKEKTYTLKRTLHVTD